MIILLKICIFYCFVLLNSVLFFNLVCFNPEFSKIQINCLSVSKIIILETEKNNGTDGD